MFASGVPKFDLLERQYAWYSDHNMDRGEALNNYLASIGEPTFIFFGPHANCTAELCSYRWSVYGYRPEMSANVFFMCVFFALLVAHVVIGARRKAWAFMSFMIAGCADEILGYAGRVCMYYDLWNFKAFMVQVVCITTAPVFFCAAIYMVLAKRYVLHVVCNTPHVSAKLLTRPHKIASTPSPQLSHASRPPSSSGCSSPATSSPWSCKAPAVRSPRCPPASARRA